MCNYGKKTSLFTLEQARSLSVSKFQRRDFTEKVNQEGLKEKKKNVGKYLGSEDSFSI